MDRRTRQKYESLAQHLVYLLGTAPDEFGLVLDTEGWIELKQVVQALSEETEWKGITQRRIEDLAWAVPDHPFEFSEKHIRLNPESFEETGPPVREPAPLPPVLYYGCRRKPYNVYREKGIFPPMGKEIVLSRTPEMALRIGQRRERKPILVEVLTREASARGSRFFSYGDHLFVVDHLAPEALSGPSLKERLPKEKPKERKRASGQEPPKPESFHPRPWDPGEDRLLARTPEKTPSKQRKERSRKHVGWKEEARKMRRKQGKNRV